MFRDYRRNLMASEWDFARNKKKKKKTLWTPASILYKSIADRYRPIKVADGPITARCRFINMLAGTFRLVNILVRIASSLATPIV